MQHPIYQGENGEDAPDYTVLSEGKIRDDNLFPSYMSCRYDESPTGRFHWDDAEGQVNNIFFDVGNAVFEATYYKDGEVKKAGGEFAVFEVNGSRNVFSGIISTTDEGSAFMELVVEQRTGEVCLITYGDPLTGKGETEFIIDLKELDGLDEDEIEEKIDEWAQARIEDGVCIDACDHINDRVKPCGCCHIEPDECFYQNQKEVRRIVEQYLDVKKAAKAKAKKSTGKKSKGAKK